MARMSEVPTTDKRTSSQVKTSSLSQKGMYEMSVNRQKAFIISKGAWVTYINNRLKLEAINHPEGTKGPPGIGPAG